jgi:hypothetical protein
VLEKEGGKKNGIFSDNLDLFRDDFEEGEKLVEFPPLMSVIWNKGQFFDIAYNYIAYPDAVGEIKEEKKVKAEEKKEGGGFMKSLFGF